MAHALDGCYLKLDRAAEHIEAFADKSARFLERRPYALSAQVNAQGTQCQYWYEPTEDPPARLSALVGDCVANLRAALDRCAYELSALAGKAPATPLEFPIFTSEREFRDPQRGQRLMRDIRNPTARAMIEDLQPFHRPSAVRAAHPLAVLDRLCAMDRYRLMPLARPHAVAVRLNGGEALHPLHAKPFGKRTLVAALPAHAPPDKSPGDEVVPRLALAFSADHIPYTGDTAVRVLRLCGNAVLEVLSEVERRHLVPERFAAAG